MHASNTVRPPRWYWVVSGIALAWMLIGVFAWVADLMTDEAAVAGFTDAQRQLYAARPSWIFAVYAAATFAGLAGAIALLLRRSWAVPALAVSLAAIIVQFGYTFLVLDAARILGATTALPFPITIFVIGAALLYFAMLAGRSGWLRGGAAATPALETAGPSA
jgi:hypothetical protein